MQPWFEGVDGLPAVLSDKQGGEAPIMSQVPLWAGCCIKAECSQRLGPAWEIPAVCCWGKCLRRCCLDKPGGEASACLRSHPCGAKGCTTAESSQKKERQGLYLIWKAPAATCWTEKEAPAQGHKQPMRVHSSGRADIQHHACMHPPPLWKHGRQRDLATVQRCAWV